METIRKLLVCFAALAALHFGAKADDRYYSDTTFSCMGEEEYQIVLKVKNDSLYVYNTSLSHTAFHTTTPCSLKCLSDSLYVIHYNPLETPQWRHEVTIKPDSTLEGRTRVIIRAPKLTQIHNVIMGCYSSMDNYMIDGIFVYDFQKPRLSPEEVEFYDTTLPEFGFRPSFVPTIGKQCYGIKEYLFSCPKEINLREGNKVVDFYFPELDDSILKQFYINHNIIILTDKHIVWNGVEFPRVSPESICKGTGNQ